MKKSLILSIASIAIVSLQGIAVAADHFDAPGPGYRQQIERISPPKDRTVSFRIQSPTVTLSSLNDESLLSQPIRLTLGGPTQATTKQRQ